MILANLFCFGTFFARKTDEITLPFRKYDNTNFLVEGHYRL